MKSLFLASLGFGGGWVVFSDFENTLLGHICTEQEHGRGEGLRKSLNAHFLWFTMLQYWPLSYGSWPYPRLFTERRGNMKLPVSLALAEMAVMVPLHLDKLPCVPGTSESGPFSSLFYFRCWEESGFTCFCMGWHWKLKDFMARFCQKEPESNSS